MGIRVAIPPFDNRHHTKIRVSAPAPYKNPTVRKSECHGKCFEVGVLLTPQKHRNKFQVTQK